MRAVWMNEFGGPDVLAIGEAPEPTPGPGQAVIDVVFANITFVETQFRASGKGPFKPELPMIPGNGVGGLVTAVGRDVDHALLGRRVVASTGGSGGYAEKVAADARSVIPVPDDIELDAAVALMADGRTAVLLARAAGLLDRELATPPTDTRVLVEAAAGGVGLLLVQLAGSAGSTVVAAAGGPRKLEIARAHGAAEAVDYREPGWSAGIAPVHVVFDGVGGRIAREAFELLEPGGRMISFGLASGAWADIPDALAAARGVSVERLPGATPQQLREATERALAEAAAGRLRTLIGQRFALDRAAAAHAAIEARATVGKTLLVAR